MERVTARICGDIEPERPVQLAKVFVKFANADEVAADDP